MDAFVVRKKRKVSNSDVYTENAQEADHDLETTDFKLTVLASLHPKVDSSLLLEALLASDGSIESASEILEEQFKSAVNLKRDASAAIGRQGSLSSILSTSDGSLRPAKIPLTKKGKTLHLYSPKDIEEHTPCSIIHNFLPANEADALLKELLEEAPTFGREKFRLFDRVVESPHSMCFYVDSWDEAERQKTEFIYNGSRVRDVRKTLPQMAHVRSKVKAAVNAEIQRRIRERYPDGKKLKYQSPKEWDPNASFVNCYDGGKESVGYHSDQLTYLGPRAIIGSLSLGVAREFRVRRIIPKDDADSCESKSPATATQSDMQGQISIHLPHNSLLVMHADMQEEWKHAIAPAPNIVPHPVAGNKRLNVTYRHYRSELHPKFTPKCRCGVPCVLRCVMRQKGSRGRYVWMCHAGYRPEAERDGCGYFEWGRFNDDGVPDWAWEREKEGNDNHVEGNLKEGQEKAGEEHIEGTCEIDKQKGAPG